MAGHLKKSKGRGFPIYFIANHRLIHRKSDTRFSPGENGGGSRGRLQRMDAKSQFRRAGRCSVIPWDVRNQFLSSTPTSLKRNGSKRWSCGHNGWRASAHWPVELLTTSITF